MSKKKIKKLYHSIQYKSLLFFNNYIKEQRKNTLNIPIIIINFNQLENLKHLIDFLLKRKFSNIVIVDNNSDYAPLIEYYETIKGKVKVERMDNNYGHMVFFKNPALLKKYAKGYYVVTDADILPNPNLPENFMDVLLQKLDKYYYHILKVGFALDIDTIPNHYPLKDKVINWENIFWTEELEDNIYKADIDTTFALYKPNYPKKFYVKNTEFHRAIRIAGDFTCKHMGWYLNPRELSEEQQHYLKTSSTSASWKFDNEGNLNSSFNY